MFPELLFLIVLALAASWLLLLADRKGPGPASGLLYYFLLFFLIGWSVSLWLVPVGPQAYEFHWAGPAIATLLMAFIFMAIIPSASRRRIPSEEARRQAQETPQEIQARHAVEFGLILFFWIAVIGLTLVIAANYLSA